MNKSPIGLEATITETKYETILEGKYVLTPDMKKIPYIFCFSCWIGLLIMFFATYHDIGNIFFTLFGMVMSYLISLCIMKIYVDLGVERDHEDKIEDFLEEKMGFHE